MIHLTSFGIGKKKTRNLAIPVCIDKEIHSDPAIIQWIEEARRIKEFKGDRGDEITLYHFQETGADRIILMGIGKHEKIDADTLRSVCGKYIKKCIKLKFPKASIAVPSPSKLEMPIDEMLVPMMEGACLANHLFDLYKNEKKHKPLKSIDFLVERKNVKKYAYLSPRIMAACKGTLMARDWINTPSNDKRPEQLADAIAAEARKAGLGVKILHEAALKRLKFGSMLAVASGSSSKPRMVILTHSRKAVKKKVVLVGKGVTFDSGGINLKPSGSLEDMKIDMSGAAAVAATLISAAELDLKMNLVGVIPIVENMVSGNAVRPGDVITSYSGKTVEIGNTDAEGRLILVDAMAYAIKTYKPDMVIDLATLTGACVVALGEKIAGVFSDEDTLADAIITSGEKTFERCWRLPLPEDYAELLKSDVADINNIGKTRWGGAITAALFLKDFVGDTRWAHIDIAGPASAKKPSDYCDAGGTGFGVRLLLDVMERL